MKSLEEVQRQSANLFLGSFLERAGNTAEARAAYERGSKGWTGGLPSILGRDALARLPKPR